MKLYLSSYRLGDDPQKLVDLVGNNKKVAVIVNAWDYSDDTSRRAEGMKKEFDGLKALGFEPQELDLRQYFGNYEKLAKKMNEFALIWVVGGNTFILRRAFFESGMGKWLIDHKNYKEFVYAGYSAGICVLSPSLKGLETVDDPNVEAKGYKPGIIWEGLGLIDFAFAPHFESNHPESALVNDEVKYYKENNIPFKALHDGEVIIQEI